MKPTFWPLEFVSRCQQIRKILLLSFNNLLLKSCNWLDCLQLNDGLEHLLKLLDSMLSPSRLTLTIHRGFHQWLLDSRECDPSKSIFFSYLYHGHQLVFCLSVRRNNKREFHVKKYFPFWSTVYNFLCYILYIL